MSTLEVTVPPDSQTITLVRDIDAPRKLVFDTMMDPALVPQWWGPARLTTTVEVMEPRAGGSWRYVQKDSDGTEYGFHGVYHDVAPGERVVQTFEFEGMPGHVSLETMTLEDLDRRTRVTSVSVFQSKQDRDGMAASGMETGAAETYDRLEALITSRL
jgi:uncharacterized protein YndB with AHSA1/START domain